MEDLIKEIQILKEQITHLQASNVLWGKNMWPVEIASQKVILIIGQMKMVLQKEKVLSSMIKNRVCTRHILGR